MTIYPKKTAMIEDIVYSNARHISQTIAKRNGLHKSKTYITEHFFHKPSDATVEQLGQRLSVNLHPCSYNLEANKHTLLEPGCSQNSSKYVDIRKNRIQYFKIKIIRKYLANPIFVFNVFILPTPVNTVTAFASLLLFNG
mgnify:CR=1 FL=1